jgi:hypothetical protein
MNTAQRYGKYIAYGYDDEIMPDGQPYWARCGGGTIRYFTTAEDQHVWCARNDSRIAHLVHWKAAAYRRMIVELDRYVAAQLYALTGSFGNAFLATEAARKAYWAGKQLETEATMYYQACHYLKEAGI